MPWPGACTARIAAGYRRGVSAEMYTTSPAVVGALVAAGGALFVRHLGSADVGAVVALGGVVGATSLTGLAVSAAQGALRVAAVAQSLVLAPALVFAAWLLDDATKYGPLSTVLLVEAAAIGAATIAAFATRAR